MLGPVFRLEMVTTARRFRYYAVRAGYTSILLFAVWMCYVNCFDNAPHWTIGRSARFSLSFFAAFSVIQLTAAILFTCAICAGTISQERQRRTIEYLFATDLTNSELVLGKLAGRLLNVLALLAASIPILFLTMFFGGVSANWVLQISAISVSTVLFSAAVSICLSIWSPRSRDAILRALVTLALLFFVVPYCIFLGQIVSPRLFLWLSPITTYLFHINPFLFISATFGSPIGMEATPGWEGVGAIVWRHCLASAALLAVAVWRVRRVHLDADVRPKKASKPQRLLRWRPGVGRFPMVWKANNPSVTWAAGDASCWRCCCWSWRRPSLSSLPTPGSGSTRPTTSTFSPHTSPPRSAQVISWS
jgi:ABC-type transport system involved in multi-copper enzyme maturation permease subunit